LKSEAVCKVFATAKLIIKEFPMRLAMIFVIALFSFSFIQNATVPAALHNQSAGLKVESYSDNTITLEWDIPAMHYTATDGPYVLLDFSGCSYPTQPGKPQLPYYEFMLGIPPGAQIQASLGEVAYETVAEIVPVPVSIPGRDSQKISVNAREADSLDYNFLPVQVIDISPQQFFRDLAVVRIKFYPLRYEYATKTLTILKSAKINVSFSTSTQMSRSMTTGSKLENLYNSFVLNYAQARKWLVEVPRSLSKSVQAADGPWYRIDVDQEGLYKINRQILSAAGIDMPTLDPRTVKIFNHGGMPLPAKTGGTDPGALGPLENAILVVGESDGTFDTDDYILFYGKPLGGWAYSATANDFAYQQHPYDTKNYYWLSFGGTNGKRMSVVPQPVAPPAITDTYFVQRAHFEEDKYNLLSSGCDWYGHRFYGLNGNATFTNSLDYPQAMTQPARMRIKFKSGNGIKYGTPSGYYYWFTVYLNSGTNPTPLVISSQMGSQHSIELSRNFNSADYLINGNNTVAVEYRGNLSDCNAYLDWMEFYYPHPLQVANNALNFYTNSTGQLVGYEITGFSSGEASLYDITDPIDVKILDNDSGVQNGKFSITLDLSENQPRHLLISSANSAMIKSVSTITHFEPKLNLLDPNLSADLIIITHPSFQSYAAEVAALRSSGADPLRCLVVDINDIYFYFGSAVKDVMAIRDFIRYAYYNWAQPSPLYVLLYGDGHYDYRNIALADTNRIPPFEISDDFELDSRPTDQFFVDVNYNGNDFNSIVPDLAIGRLPAESTIDAKRITAKIQAYENSKERDGWQTVLTFVADDEVSGSGSSSEWEHQKNAESLASLSNLNKFIKQKIYLSAYPSVPGGFGRVKPAANQAIIDQLNEGTLLINWVGHGNPETWAHEYVLLMSRDLSRIQNEGRLPFWIAATCDFGKYDDPAEPSFSEALVWEQDRGAIAVLSSARLVFSGDNFTFNRRFLTNLFLNGQPSRRLGDALLLSSSGSSNDQKYHLFGDPSMHLADPRNLARIDSVTPDTLKALSKVRVDGSITSADLIPLADFSGGAYLIVNDARFDSVNTGGNHYYTLIGPRIFKGEISVANGLFRGEFIVPKSIRYKDRPTGRITLYAWSEDNNINEAIGYTDNLLFNGTVQNLSDDKGPEINLYFKDQENFNSGDLVSLNPVLIAELSDESGINLTREVGHTIEIQIDDNPFKDITSFFAYQRDSYSRGHLNYHMENLESGEHQLLLQVWDNINNPAVAEIAFKVAASSDVVLTDVYNYPNPFQTETNFTFQAQGLAPDAEIQIRVYTISGRLIKKIDNLPRPQQGFNYYPWNGRDEDGDLLANGVYLYKILLKNAGKQKEIIEKLLILR
jgi:hypothetical protein